MRSKSRPVFHTRLTTYQELRDFGKAFAEGHLRLLILLGPPGIGKSHTLREWSGNESCWIAGNASPFGIYVECFHHRGEPIILDDVDGLARDRQGVRLLKALCQTEREKTVCWHTHSVALEQQNVPQSFKTASQVAILANAWFSSEDIQALEDRGHVVVFDPTPIEVHHNASEWFWDQEIFDFIADNLHLIGQHSLRTYITAWERKRAGLAWQSVVFDRCLTGTAREVARLRSDPGYASEEDRVRAFVAAGLGCRATYFNHAGKLRPAETVPRIELKRTAPPTAEKAQESLIDLLRRRHKGLGRG
jgi:hypothetical protein